jgi:hypothetical protein
MPLIIGGFLPLQNSTDVPLSVKNPNYAHGFIVQQKIDANRLETSYWPRTQVAKLWVDQRIRRSDEGLRTDSLRGFPDGFAEAKGDIGTIECDQIVSELASHIIA